MILPSYPKVRFGDVLNPEYLSSGSPLSQKAYNLLKNRKIVQKMLKKEVAIILVIYTNE